MSRSCCDLLGIV